MDAIPAEVVASLILAHLPPETINEVIQADARLPPLLQAHPAALLHPLFGRASPQDLCRMLALPYADLADHTYRRLPVYTKVEVIKILLQEGQVPLAKRLARIDWEEDCREFGDPACGIYQRHLEWRIRMYHQEGDTA